MGFTGHLVASVAAPGPAFPDAEPEPGDWAPGLHVWRVPERLGPEWEPFQVFAERLAAEVPGGFLSASVLDSDGAFVHIGIPGRDVERCWLHLAGFVSHFVLPWAPFDDAGNPLPEDVATEQDAEWERRAAAYAEEVRALGLTGDAAAVACRDWASASMLDPAPVEVVRGALETHRVFVEATFLGLLRTLGA
jgi:hypothetical protein